MFFKHILHSEWSFFVDEMGYILNPRCIAVHNVLCCDRSYLDKTERMSIHMK